MNKQIDEIEKILSEIQDNGEMRFENCGIIIKNSVVATKLYNAGYRNEKETAKEILQTIKSYDGWNELQRLRDDIAETYGVEVEDD